MTVPRTPLARSPGPSGPAELSPRAGNRRSAERTSALICSSCQRISSSSAPGRSGARQPRRLRRVGRSSQRVRAHVGDAGGLCSSSRGCHRGWIVHVPCGPAGHETPAISPAVSSSPRENARARAMASRGRSSSGAIASNKPRTRVARSAAHPATIRRSASTSVCGEPIRPPCHTHANRSSPCGGGFPPGVRSVSGTGDDEEFTIAPRARRSARAVTRDLSRGAGATSPARVRADSAHRAPQE